jgi:hypothetical protein
MTDRLEITVDGGKQCTVMYLRDGLDLESSPDLRDRLRALL